MLWTLFSVIYAAIATFSIFMTWREHIVKKRKSVLWTLLGTLTCLVWPIAVAAASAAQPARRI
ncbi:hypothetical protein [Flavimaricola marinus]|uniref:Uncharacterized protein n=1 Tax=Flavimaricola marinus TaxID=1819565 RepID=A0A238LI44_9RHOB|nr:hypothetical protein [Flavimaricola marinus]SMY09282.1 hypothetical protein LOM8899_03447 [Flavimaricola marinus]